MSNASSGFADVALRDSPIVIWNVSSFQYQIDLDRRNCQSSSQLAEDGDTRPVPESSIRESRSKMHRRCYRHSTAPRPFRLDDVWQLVSSFPRRGKSRSGLSIVPVRPDGRTIFCAHISRFACFLLSLGPSLFSRLSCPSALIIWQRRNESLFCGQEMSGGSPGLIIALG